MADQLSPTPAPAAAPADPFAEGNAADIADIFGFGEEEPPASADAEKPSPVGAEEPEAGGTQPPPAKGAAEEPPAASAEEAPPSDEKLEAASLKAQVEQLQRDLEEAKKTPPASTEKAEPAATPSAEAPTLPPIQFAMPKELREALMDEEPEKFLGAIDHLVSGILTYTRNEVAAVVGRINEIQKALAGEASGASEGDDPPLDLKKAEEAAEAARGQYYAKFPSHKGKEFQPIIAAVAAEMATQFPGHAWNDDYINALGARVNGRAKELAKLVAGDSPAPKPNLLQPGARSAAPGPGEMTQQDEIADTFDLA